MAAAEAAASSYHNTIFIPNVGHTVGSVITALLIDYQQPSSGLAITKCGYRVVSDTVVDVAGGSEGGIYLEVVSNVPVVRSALLQHIASVCSRAAATAFDGGPVRELACQLGCNSSSM